MGRPPLPELVWRFFLALSLFRMCAIVQGVYARALQGNASSGRAEAAGQMFSELAACGHGVATGDADADAASEPTLHPLDALPFAFSARARETYDRVRSFIDAEVIPNEGRWRAELEANTQAGRRWTPISMVEPIKAKAKALGLWNLFLTGESGGGRLTNVEYAPIAELMGLNNWCAEVFNSSAPDSGNMELLQLFGTEEQKARWLQPLLEGQIRSCFAMTEPDSACSDATNVQVRARGCSSPAGIGWWALGGGHWVVGIGWWALGCGHHLCTGPWVVGMGCGHGLWAWIVRVACLTPPLAAPPCFSPLTLASRPPSFATATSTSSAGASGGPPAPATRAASSSS